MYHVASKPGRAFTRFTRTEEILVLYQCCDHGKLREAVVVVVDIREKDDSNLWPPPTVTPLLP